MWREFDALNELIVEHLLGPVAKVVVRYLSSHSSATLRELKRSLRTQLLDRVRIGGITPTNRLIIQATLRACLTTLIDLGVVRYRYEHPDLPNSQCVYALSRFGALWLYGFPFLQRYILRLHCASWRLEAECALRSGESNELAQASAHVGTGAVSEEIQTVIDLCGRIPPFGRKSVRSLRAEMSNKDQKLVMNRGMLRFLIGIGLMEQCSEEACVAEALGMTPHRSELFNGDAAWSDAGANKPGCRIDEADNREASVCHNETTASRDSGVSPSEKKPLPTNDHLTVGASGRSAGERPRMRRRIRLRKLDTKAETEEFNDSRIQDTGPDILPTPTIPVVSDSVPAPAPPIDGNKDERDSFISTNLVFVRDAIRHLHISAWAAEQLHSCEDSGSASSLAQVHWRPLAHQTASILNALFYLQRVATHGVLADVLPRELLDPSWTAEASCKGFTLEQIYHVVLYRFCVPSDASLEALSPAVVQSTLSRLADDRLRFVKIYNWRNTQLYAPLYTLLLERYRLHCIEGMLLASGDLYLHRVWRMVLECGPLSTRSCEERALLPARAVRGYLFQLLHDGWIALGDEWTSITNHNSSVVQPNPFQEYSGDVLPARCGQRF
ncbi:hypothetical protein F1559_001820 [Cyanidiococcus yangmingshanensis]|uniref:DNA-directed RNA polymerase III subunit RPC3 n=1 Tax=Cyanidiococcus yangmingshanensis TaxID=2690220 RepID=A0A7J7IH44_9RHOD|nr:hypothetical protein F1559_001820 [Cyanidiococcus yangmingshanensis]